MAQRVFDSFSMSPLMLPIRLEILVLSNAVLLFLLIILNSAGVHIHGAVRRHIGDVQDPYILVLNCTDETAEHAALDVLKKDTEYAIVKSKTITTAGIELTAELRGKNASTDFVNTIANLPGVGSATLVSYNGEYLS